MSNNNNNNNQTHPPPSGTVNGNGVITPFHQCRLRVTPKSDHEPDCYDDLQSLEFSPLLFGSLERYLPLSVINTDRDVKVQYMRDILRGYAAENQRVHKHREYRKTIASNYQPLHKELYTMNPADFFVPSFLAAVNESTADSFRKIMVEPIPGVFTFEMLQPQFCDWFLSEVENFERWIHETKFRIMRPNTMNKFGAVLDDFGMETMLDKFMKDFISPISKVFFAEVGGCSLDDHHGYVVEYGVDRDTELGFHVDDSEVTLNVCVGRDFSGGDLFFKGVRCDNHVNSETLLNETMEYSQVPGHAVLHCGRHRHGARATTSGRRVNLIIWCKSSIFREMKKHQSDCSDWCGECKRIKKEKHRESINTTKLELLKRLRKATS
ncbi:hypothetical protein ACFE04_031255 [Oxalis oulophora]